jgi:hypothetical protein
MSLTRYIPATTAVIIAGVLLYPAPLRAWAHLGGELDLTQRDFRVYNNFTDPEANNNNNADISFPGATGAPLAIWKAYVEWSSELHANGSGDPTQPFDLGSGGANFDPSWQGLADSPGDTNSNIASEISGFGAGVLGYAELPISDGWRIRFYAEPIIWNDGPSAPPNTADHRDLQGVACHEFGHALGLAHSTVLGSTMFPAISIDETTLRSISTDDQLGIQALYGVASPSKPHIETYELSATGEVILHGTGFEATGNTVWFTRGSGLSDGSPVTVTGLASTQSGTKISCLIPADAGPGDVLVKLSGNSHSDLSNPFPFDPAQQHCPDVISYGVPKTTSQGSIPQLYTSGWPSAALNDFKVGTYGGTPNSFGLLFSGPAANNRPFQGGTVLVAPPIKRELIFQFDFTGSAEIAIPVSSSMPGTTRHYQLWFQDPGDSFGTGLSDAIQVGFCP